MARRTTRTLEVRIQAVEAKLTAFDKVQKKSKETKKAVSGLAKMGAKLEGAFTGWATMAVMGSFRAVSGAARKANDSFIQFETSVGRIKTLIPGQIDLQNKLAQSASRLSKVYGLQATDAANATFQAISAGVAAADAGKFMEVAAKNATAGFASMEESVSGLTTVINAYGLDVGEAAAISDSMFVANKRGVTTTRDLGNSLGAVVGMASKVGVSYRDLMAATVALTKGGISTAESMTGMRAIIASLVGPSKDAAEAADDMGIRWDIGLLKSEGMSGAVRVLGEVLNTHGVEAINKLIPRVDGVSKALTLAGETGAADFTAALAEMETQSGQTVEALNQITDSKFFKQKQALQELDESWREFGATVAPIMTALIRFAAHPIEFQIQSGEALDWVTGLNKKVVGLEKSIDAYAKRLREGNVTTAEAVRMFTDAGRVSRDFNAELAKRSGAKTAALHLELMARQAGHAGDNMGDLETRFEELAQRVVGSSASSGAATQSLIGDTESLIGTFEAEIGRLDLVAVGYKNMAKAADDPKAAQVMNATATATAGARDRVRELLQTLHELANQKLGVPLLLARPMETTKTKTKTKAKGRGKARRPKLSPLEASAAQVNLDAADAIAARRREQIRLAQAVDMSIGSEQALAAALPLTVAALAQGNEVGQEQIDTLIGHAKAAGQDETAILAQLEAARAAGDAYTKRAEAATAARKAHEELVATLGRALATDGLAGLEAALDRVAGLSDTARAKLAQLAAESQGSSLAMIGTTDALKSSWDDAFSGLANGLGASLEAFASGESGFGSAMERMTAAVLLNVGKQAAVKAIFEIAEGLATLGTPESAGHFAAAAVYGSIAGGTMAMGGSMQRGINASDKRKEESKKRDKERERERASIADRRGRGEVGGPSSAQSVVNIHVAGAHLTQREAGAAGARAAAAATRARMTQNPEQEVMM